MEVSLEAAGLILSRRLGPSQYSLLGQADEEVVKRLNQFGGRQVALLGTLSKIDDISRLLVVLEGVEPYSGMPQLRECHALSTIENTNRTDKPWTIVPSTANPFWSKLTVPRAPDDLINDIFVENLLSYGPALSSSSTLCSYNLGIDDNLDQRLFIRLSVR